MSDEKGDQDPNEMNNLNETNDKVEISDNEKDEVAQLPNSEDKNEPATNLPKDDLEQNPSQESISTENSIDSQEDNTIKMNTSQQNQKAIESTGETEQKSERDESIIAQNSENTHEHQNEINDSLNQEANENNKSTDILTETSTKESELNNEEVITPEDNSKELTIPNQDNDDQNKDNSVDYQATENPKSENNEEFLNIEQDEKNVNQPSKTKHDVSNTIKSNFNETKHENSKNPNKDELSQEKSDHLNNDTNNKKEKNKEKEKYLPILEPQHPKQHNPRNEKPPDISQLEVNMEKSGNIFLNTESTTTEEVNYSIDQIAHLVIEDEDYTHVNNDNFDKVVSRIHRIHRDAHNNGDYELAEISKAASQSLIQYFNEERLSSLNEAKVNEMNKLYEARKKDLQYLKEHWKVVYQNAKQMANSEMLQLQTEQDEELAEFDAKMNNILSDLDKNLPPQYKKYSAKIIGLRNVQKSMIKVHKYVEAKQLGQEIEIMEQEEQKTNIELFKKKLETDREDLIKKQDEQFRVKYQSWERELEKIDHISKMEISKAENRKNQVEKKVNKAHEVAEMTTQSSLQTQRGGNLSMNSQLSSYKSANCISSSFPKSARPGFGKNPTVLNPAAQEFRQRAIINRITYSNIVVPKIKRPGQRQKPKSLR